MNRYTNNVHIDIPECQLEELSFSEHISTEIQNRIDSIILLSNLFGFRCKSSFASKDINTDYDLVCLYLKKFKYSLSIDFIIYNDREVKYIKVYENQYLMGSVAIEDKEFVELLDKVIEKIN